MTVGITIEARMASTRLPNKVLADLHGKPMLERMIERLKRVKLADIIVLATTDLSGDDMLTVFATDQQILYSRGSNRDVLGRVLNAAKDHGIDTIVETCGDCPVIDPKLLDLQIATFLCQKVDFVGTIGYPLGLGARVFSTKTLEEVANKTDDPYHRENVSTYIYENFDMYECSSIESSSHVDLDLSVDTQEDLDMIRGIYSALYDENPEFDYDDILDYLGGKND